LKKLKDASEEKTLDEPLLDIKVNNPLSRLYKLLNQLKKKQTTTITFRLGIPLIALPVLITAFAGLFFGLGKVTTQPKEKIVEVEKEPDFVNVSKAGLLKIMVGDAESTYYLIMPSGEAIKLNIPSSFNVSNYDGKRILATGKYYTKDQLIVVDSISGLEVLPLRPSPIPTQIPTPTPSEIVN